MDELFRLNIMRPPNVPSTQGIGLDYTGVLRSPDNFETRLVGRIKLKWSASIGDPEATFKKVARAVASNFPDVYATLASLRVEPMRPTLLEFAAEARAEAKPLA